MAAFRHTSSTATSGALADAAKGLSATVQDAVAEGFSASRHSVQVLRNELLAQSVHRLTVRDAYIAERAQPGQFATLYSPDPLKLLPRPLGISEVHGEEVSFIFAVVGEGTRDFAQLNVGDVIDVLGPLGNGYDMSASARYLLVGGGLGVPPLIYAAQRLHERAASQQDVRVSALFGYRNERFADALVAGYADEVMSITNAQGNVINLLDERAASLKARNDDDSTDEPTVMIACGPIPMLKAVARWANDHAMPCQVSLEERMGCGYGTCVVCAVDTVDGRLKVCTDGPVFDAQRLVW